ncbi:putative telomerase reverse transcriptase [Trypanosoma grayi]|uniref:putative telomerase reverse transcriptase n=1 Tax=Trypanosoma grayi TaxID=71804 RepID=UPI0004F49A4B|nr:putative telomerase reverse transcriptase [Trypanosoma grayi]KEG11154.1 putative telomerase reverse transcriptase [Trypanosoma grayi]
MSWTFPIVPGYDGPWSLKDFVQRYFFVQLCFEASPETSCPPSPRTEQHLVVCSTGGFAVVVYVSLSAPPPPMIVGLAATAMGQDSQPRVVDASLRGRPVTSSMLRHEFWNSFFTQIGSAAVSFITMWCPMVVQFEALGGGLQVLGPPLKNAVPRAVKRYRRVEWVRPRKVTRLEPKTQHDSASNERSSLYCLNVSRLPLIGEAPQRMFAEVDRAVDPMLARLWHEHHSVSDATTTWCSMTTGNGSMTCAEKCCALTVAQEVVHRVFPYTLSTNDIESTASLETVRQHLTHILHCLLGSVCRMNIRGAAIRHTGFLEERSLTAHSRQRQRGDEDAMHAAAVVPVSELTAPETLIASYLQSLLETMWWRSPVTAERVSFWGNELILKKLCDIALDWLRCGRHEVFSLSHFLHGIPVAQIPWLCGFYTKFPAQKRRSMIQQRVFLQLIFFLFQHVVPFLVRRSFHVTWSSKTPNVFSFIPKPVWIRLVCRELRQVFLRREARTNNDGAHHAALPPMALERVTSREVVWSKAATAARATVPLTGNSGNSPLLYSSIRFLLDRRKLRPIARVRFVSMRSLSKMANGVRAPASARTLKTPPPTATVLRGALRCLLAGVEEHRARSGLARPINVSHQDEYTEIRSFVEEARRFRESPLLLPTCSMPSTVPLECVAVTMVRGDAARCYDCLPQDAVMDVVHRLVPHELYYTLWLTTIAPSPSGGRSGGSRCGAERQSPSETGVGESNDDVPLHQSTRQQTFSDKCVQAGVISGIARGCIVYEESSLGPGSTVRGDEVRSNLTQHLQAHFVVIDGKLYMQRVGITQGSAVAMLLCDTLLETVDLSLSNILAEHEEPALLLRRVDDVLVVTLSRVAAARCDEALRCGWPQLGFSCQREKLRCSSTTPVAWCGLLWDPTTLQFSVEWARLAPLLPNLAVRPRTGNELLLCSMRLMSILCLRTPLTVLCRRINTKARVVQTLYEVGILWSRFVLQKIVENAPFMRPHVRTFLKPLALAVVSLRRLVRRQRNRLEQLGSFCDVTHDEVQLCVLAALRNTLKERLPWMIARTHRHGGDKWKRFLLIISAVVQRKLEVVLSAVAAFNERCTGAGGVASASVDDSIAGVGALLMAEGPGTVVARALEAVQFGASRGAACHRDQRPPLNGE